MSKLFDERGNLTEKGQQLTVELRHAVLNIMESDEVCDMSEHELRLLGSYVNQLIGDTISDRIAKKLQVSKKFQAMTDEEFNEYLKEKYGTMWQFMSLTEEEYARVPPLTAEKIEELLKGGAKHVSKIPQSGVVFPPKTNSPWWPKMGPTFK